MTDAAPGTSGHGERRSRDASVVPPLLSTLQEVWQELPGLISDRVELLSLELRRAGITLAQVVVLVLAAAILAVTAWLVLWGGHRRRSRVGRHAHGVGSAGGGGHQPRCGRLGRHARQAPAAPPEPARHPAPSDGRPLGDHEGAGRLHRPTSRPTP